MQFILYILIQTNLWNLAWELSEEKKIQNLILVVLVIVTGLSHISEIRNTRDP